MISVKLRYRGDDIVSVTVKGHSGYARQGRDIVCAAVSAITQTALLGLIDISKEKQSFDLNEEVGYLAFEVASEDEKNSIKQQAILKAMELGLRDVEKGYKPYVKMEVE